MVVTVPLSRAALLDEFPELVHYQRAATRLHPRPGAPDRRESSVGGPLLWPTAEPWPTCSQGHQITQPRLTAAEQAAGIPPRPWSLYGLLPEPVVLVPILQLYVSDAPQLSFPDGTDLLQILWCPNIHTDWAPRARAFWRRTADIRDPLPQMPAPNRVEGERFVPQACVVHPEQVSEFPPVCWQADPVTLTWPRMPLELDERVRDWNDQQPESADYHVLAHAPGWKVGGWDHYIPDRPKRHICACGADMRPLLTTDSMENLDGWPPHEDPGFVWGDPNNWRDQEPTGVRVGRSGISELLYCPAAPTHPLRHVIVY